MGEIPNEILERAQLAYSMSKDDVSAARIIAEQIWLERQRCADLALTHMIRHQGPDGSAWAAADEIAESILTH